MLEIPNEPEQIIGKVIWFSKDLGYGFIQSAGKQYFVHHNDIEGEGFKMLHEQQRVRFSATTGPRGLVAKDVIASKM